MIFLTTKNNNNGKIANDVLTSWIKNYTKIEYDLETYVGAENDAVVDFWEKTLEITKLVQLKYETDSTCIISMKVTEPTNEKYWYEIHDLAIKTGVDELHIKCEKIGKRTGVLFNALKTINKDNHFKTKLFLDIGL